MPIPKWCDKKSIRTVKKGKGQIMFCCRKGHWKKRAWNIAGPLSHKCEGGMTVLEVRSAKLIKGAKKEKREHPWASMTAARKIARDHLARNPKAYGALYSSAGINWISTRGASSVQHGRIPGVSGRLTKITDSSGVRIFHTGKDRSPRLVGAAQTRDVAEAQAVNSLRNW